MGSIKENENRGIHTDSETWKCLMKQLREAATAVWIRMVIARNSLCSLIMKGNRETAWEKNQEADDALRRVLICCILFMWEIFDHV